MCDNCGSQELLEAVVRERSFRVTPPRNATIFHHPTLGDFELQHVWFLATLGILFLLFVIKHITVCQSGYSYVICKL